MPCAEESLCKYFRNIDSKLTAIMDFAERQLSKYGWMKGNLDASRVLGHFVCSCVTGKGLGKKEDGISEPIKVKLKRDNCGVS